MKLTMATRGSRLALAQSGTVAAALVSLNPGLEVETLLIRTSGDRFPLQTPQEARALAQGAKGLFVKELEEALAAGRADLAVHSAKDLPAELAPGLVVAAYPRREDPRDAFIGRDALRFDGLKPGARIGTSSLRRQVQLNRARPGLVMLPMRGNVDTRLGKLAGGACDGLVLAVAGLLRLGLSHVPHEPLDEELVLPAPGQGALAVEACADRAGVLGLLAGLDDGPTRAEVELERGLLRELGGGCSVPLAARARNSGAETSLEVFFSDADGSRAVRLGGVCRAAGDAGRFVKELAARVRAARP